MKTSSWLHLAGAVLSVAAQVVAHREGAQRPVVAPLTPLQAAPKPPAPTRMERGEIERRLRLVPVLRVEDFPRRWVTTCPPRPAAGAHVWGEW